jgi:hypothetical protein
MTDLSPQARPNQPPTSTQKETRMKPMSWTLRRGDRPRIVIVGAGQPAGQKSFKRLASRG